MMTTRTHRRAVADIHVYHRAVLAAGGTSEQRDEPCDRAADAAVRVARGLMRRRRERSFVRAGRDSDASRAII